MGSFWSAMALLRHVLRAPLLELQGAEPGPERDGQDQEAEEEAPADAAGAVPQRQAVAHRREHAAVADAGLVGQAAAQAAQGRAAAPAALAALAGAEGAAVAAEGALAQGGPRWLDAQHVAARRHRGQQHGAPRAA